jgi:hypothetical protein
MNIITVRAMTDAAIAMNVDDMTTKYRFDLWHNTLE